MAENTACRNNALPYPVYGAPWVVVVPILDADGDPVTSAAGLDNEISKNGDTAADAGTEAEIGNGDYSVVLSATDMTADVVAGTLKTSTSGAKNTKYTLHPRKLVTVRSGTAAGGTSSTITLDSGASPEDDAYNGMFIQATLDSNVECRIISDYNGSTKVATVVPNWNTTPDSDDTFVIKLPEGVQLPTIRLAGQQYQRAIKAVYDCRGTVWLVSSTGNDTSGDGLTWDTAYATIGKAASVAAAGDLILVGEGSYTYSTTVSIPQGVNLFGSGPGTRVTCDDQTIALKFNGHQVFQDFSFNSYLGIGHRSAGATVERVVLRRLYSYDDLGLDGIYIHDTDGTSHYEIVCEDCVFGSQADALALVSADATSWIEARNCTLNAEINGGAGTIRVHGGTSKRANAGNGSIELYGVQFDHAATYDCEETGSGSILAVDCTGTGDNGALKTSGNVTVRNRLQRATDTSGAALGTAAKLKRYIQLLARSDAAITTDAATELSEINENAGSGAGDYAATVDSLEAATDRTSGAGSATLAKQNEILAKLNPARVVASSSVTQNNTITIDSGDDYDVSDSTALQWTAEDLWSTFSGGTLELSIMATSDYEAGTGSWTALGTGTITQSGDDAVLKVAITAAQSAALSTAPTNDSMHYTYRLRVTQGDGDIITVAKGAMTVRR